jgi:hypothetical protein
VGSIDLVIPIYLAIYFIFIFMVVVYFIKFARGEVMAYARDGVCENENKREGSWLYFTQIPSLITVYFTVSRGRRFGFESIPNIRMVFLSILSTFSFF